VIELRYPFPEPPPNGMTLEIGPGLHWLRLPLPFRLNHVNVYLIEGEGGWTIIDAGVDTSEARALWEGVLGGLLAGKPVERLIVTHYHPDHVGAAAWLCRRTGAELAMGETEFLTARVHRLATPGDLAAERDFYLSHGLTQEQLGHMSQRLDRYRSVVPDLPRHYSPLRVGDRLRLGPLEAEVMIQAGHSPAQVLLHAPAHDLLFAADQVLPQISPNVSVAEEKPADDPLGHYLASLAELPARVPDRTLVLPGHRLPFFGLHGRCAELAAHHAARCADLARFCDPAAPPTAAEIVPLLFTMELDAHQFWFAFSETLAHVNLMARRGELLDVRDGELRRWRRA
jgi:glyoxylase-like metal-dependent hydrolase (beta-lactamase superfamily II)